MLLFELKKGEHDDVAPGNNIALHHGNFDSAKKETVAQGVILFFSIKR